MMLSRNMGKGKGIEFYRWMFLSFITDGALPVACFQRVAGVGQRSGGANNNSSPELQSLQLWSTVNTQ
ncbi:MAG: hypothetical protein RMZ69_32705 [Nostoc sp. ChiQUE01a]|nr:hypothetical protein [Nostoc sp. ChiQUE01a]